MLAIRTRRVNCLIELIFDLLLTLGTEFKLVDA